MYATPTENMKRFFSTFINETSTISNLSPFLEGKSINARFSKKHTELLARTQTPFSEIANRLNTIIPI